MNSNHEFTVVICEVNVAYPYPTKSQTQSWWILFHLIATLSLFSWSMLYSVMKSLSNACMLPSKVKTYVIISSQTILCSLVVIPVCKNNMH